MANTVDHLCTRQSREEAVVVVWEIPITTAYPHTRRLQQNSSVTILQN